MMKQAHGRGAACELLLPHACFAHGPSGCAASDCIAPSHLPASSSAWGPATTSSTRASTLDHAFAARTTRRAAFSVEGLLPELEPLLTLHPEWFSYGPEPEEQSVASRLVSPYAV